MIILVLGLVLYFHYKEDNKMEEPKYQGPVPEGYDEEHFRKTGETKKLNVDNSQS